MLLVLASCANDIVIKDTKTPDSISKEAVIRTTHVEIIENNSTIPPSVKILFPEEGQIIKNLTIDVKVGADNFNVVPVGSHVKEGEGHFHVWLDSEMKIGAYNDFIFENLSEGRHSITAELVMSNHSSLNPRAIKTISVNVEPEISEGLQPESKEFSAEADDYGFYPGNFSAKLNDKIKINFKFRDDKIYYGGLDIKGPFDAVKYRHGNTQPMIAEFVLNDNTKITSYWPASGVRKADLMVNVEK